MERREFVTLCATSAAAAAVHEARGESLGVRMYWRAKLVDESRAPLRLKSLKVGMNYVSDYPFAATPCFLLRLDRPIGAGVALRTETGQAYKWEGGIGEGRSIVAYSAICAHKMTYPTRQVSFIGYREGPSPVAGPGRVTTCCSDRSVYDPPAGARVVSGPAPPPPPPILVEHHRRPDTT